MQILEERIRQSGKVKPGNVLKVDSFLNHQMDIHLFEEIGQEFFRRFSADHVTKILTIEASGIGVACITAHFFQVPVVFAKKSQSSNISPDLYTSQVESYTHGKVYDILVSKEYLHADDRILIIDDFLANGKAILGLAELVKAAGATLVGAGVVIEKGFQGGGDQLRADGLRVESLAIVDEMSEGGHFVFRH